MRENKLELPLSKTPNMGQTSRHTDFLMAISTT
jgi:hypothetical protein